LSPVVTLRARLNPAVTVALRHRKSRADLLFRRRRRPPDIGNEGQFTGTPGDGRRIL